MRNCYLDIHILQTVPPSNLNRDDAGTPKHATYGGVRRARVSSQAWKRATRELFNSQWPIERRGVRTRRLTPLLAQRIAERAHLDQVAAQRIADHILKPLGISSGTKADATAYLLFLGYRQLDAIADLVVDQLADLATLPDAELEKRAKELPVKNVLASGHPLDVALFGRMVADLSDLNVEAAVQVAHALSTHAVDVEFDYYTAVDDENTADTGAGMIGTVEFNSATLYRYATLGLHLLEENLADPAAAVDGAVRFVDAFTRSMPSGKANSFAPRTLPSLVALAVRTDQPVNLVSAFERPVRPHPDNGGIIAQSARRLAEELRAVAAAWGSDPDFTGATYTHDDDTLRQVFGPSRPFNSLLDQIKDVLTAHAQGSVQ